MRKVIATEYLTLDGVMENPMWSAPYWGEDIAQFKLDELLASDALLMGRVTYEDFARAWPGRTDEQGFAQRMNSLPKHVVTATLTQFDWDNSHPIRQNMAEEITRLREQEGQAVLLSGSAQLVRSLMANDLIDEYRFLVFPVVLGGGKRLFDSGAAPTNLKLMEARSFASGATLLRYEPDRK